MANPANRESAASMARRTIIFMSRYDAPLNLGQARLSRGLPIGGSLWAAIGDSGMRSFLLATAGMAVLGVSACASNKPVSTPNVALPAAFSQPGQAAVELDHWWTSYNDPELTKLVEGALATAPEAPLIEQR